MNVKEMERKAMNLKRMIAVVSMAVLLVLLGGSCAETYVFPVEPAALTETDISMADAISVAKNEMTQQQGIALDDFRNYKIKANLVELVNGEKAWVVMLDEMSCGSDALVTISSDDATIIDYQASETEITMFLLDQWIKKKGAMRTWSLEDKALFNWLFGSSDQYVVPREEQISKEKARDIALSAIPEALSSPEFSYTYSLLSYTDGRPDLYVWMITVLIDGQPKYLVHIAAVDGTVVEVYNLGENS